MIGQKGAPEARILRGSRETGIAAGESHLGVIVPRSARECNPDLADDLVVVADRRGGDRCSVHCRVVDEWGSVIGLSGVGLYALYARLAAGGVPSAHKPWADGGEVAHLHRLLQWCGLTRADVDGSIVLIDPPARSVERLRRLETCLFNAVACTISPTWTRALARVKRLVGRVAS